MSNCMSSSCAPPHPPYVTCCCVMLCAPTHFEHGTPIMLSLLSVCVRKFSYFSFFGGSSYDFVKVFYFIPFPFPSSIAPETMFRECCPPSHFSQKPHAFLKISSCTHTQKSTPTHLPHSRPQPSILYIFRNPATHSFKNPHTH